jgi:hypothetical protein
MRLRTTRTWKTRGGKQRVIRLYNNWRNLNCRTRGTGRAGNGANYWQGKEVGWESFEAFRTWALANGYSKERCSLDRRNPERGYTPDNCRWLTRVANTAYQNACMAARGLAGDPENYPDVPF